MLQPCPLSRRQRPAYAQGHPRQFCHNKRVRLLLKLESPETCGAAQSVLDNLAAQGNCDFAVIGAPNAGGRTPTFCSVLATVNVAGWTDVCAAAQQARPALTQAVQTESDTTDTGSSVKQRAQ